MKKIIFAAFLFFAIGNTAFSQTQDTASTNTKYWYYPSQNVYYNNESGNYWYYDQATTKWSTSKILPDTYVVTKESQHYDIYYKGSDVWMDNKTHKSKYNNNDKPAK